MSNLFLILMGACCYGLGRVQGVWSGITFSGTQIAARHPDIARLLVIAENRRRAQDAEAAARGKL